MSDADTNAQRQQQAQSMILKLGQLLKKQQSDRASNRRNYFDPSLGITTLPPQPPLQLGPSSSSDVNLEERKKGNDREEQIESALKSVRNALSGFGVLPPQTKHVNSIEDPDNAGRKTWSRSMPSNLFQPPKNVPSLTTILPLSRVPPGAKIRKRSNGSSAAAAADDILNNRNGGQDELVEVWAYSLTPDYDETGKNCINDLHQRPLQGNLSSKLVEYTRGAMGVRRPFRPGGLDDQDEINLHNEYYVEESDTKPSLSEEDYYLSEEATINARKALTLGSKEAWKQGLLLTSPPGMSFKVGLSYEDVFICDDDELKEIRESRQSIDGDHKDAIDFNEKQDANATTPSQAMERSTIFGNIATAPTSAIFDKSYFDEDSLFGDSTSGSDGDSVSDSDRSEDGTGSDAMVQSDDRKQVAVAEDFIPTAIDSSSPTDDVDMLLSELNDTLQSPMDQAFHAKKATQSSSTTTIHPPVNPKTDDNHPKTRKSWAVTDCIPLTNSSDFHTLLPNPALTFPFELDDFQKQAILRLERSECVFLAAHTSAGKTVCAEYAIALAKKHCTRAIYTSPIKALSNQKYRDFRNKFGEDVGLITGDMQIGADGSCLIMTTEILRSMLYRGADLIRDIEWVIFDEVHYINDSERGVVWEEVIIMLPDYVNLIFLSATTPNTIEFSEWIGRTKRKPVHVIRTNYRPVPLSHHLWAGLKLHSIMEGKQGFKPSGYSEAAKALLPASARAAAENGGTGKGVKTCGKGGSASVKPSSVAAKPASGSRLSSWQAQGSKQDWISLTRFLEREGLMPTVCFSFSKKKCEELANMLRSLDLNTAAERNLVTSFAIQTVNRLSPVDSKLPQVLTTVEMVKRGIGVHHGGLLPILKEMVEILFSRNLIKILFATETFAMGVNMPARCVVFNAIRKHDGTQFRELQPGEYTQMAGRAGRRGLDKVGTVIICCFGDQPPPQVVLKNMLTGSSTKLQSQFRLTYTMILNLLRVEDMSVEGMIKRSFSEFATQRALTSNEYPKLLARGTKTLLKLDEDFAQESDGRIGAEDIEDYYFSCRNVLSSSKELLSFILSGGGTGGGALTVGRVLLVTSARKHGLVRAPSIVLRPPALSSKPSVGNKGNTDSTVCIVLMPESYTPSKHHTELKLGTLNYVGEASNRYFAIYEIQLDEILLVSSVKHKIDCKVFFNEVSKTASNSDALTALGNPFAGAKSMKGRSLDIGNDNPFAGMMARGKKGSVSSETKKSSSQDVQSVNDVMSYLVDAESIESKSGIDILDLRECAKNMHQGNSVMEFGNAFTRMERDVGIMRQFRSHYHPNLERHYLIVERKESLRSRVKMLRHLLSNESLALFPDFLQRKACLQTMGYVDENDTVCLKGRVACEVNTCEGLIVTEMVFAGILNELEPAEIVAALSALIFQEKTDEGMDSELPERLVTVCERMREIARHLGQEQKNHGLPVDPLEYSATSLKLGLVHVVFEWACGVPFSSICELTDVQEGSIVRCITRLDELCREVRNCARVVGNPTLYRKMEAASEAIKRDIVFASSLYVS
mmetsp:Transcript_6609/g.14301  ORF Transcript_6609/g.14301 Transcript_6609/m.14301 type:complete len:1541 (-) Transcript_6609:94-4716(-)